MSTVVEWVVGSINSLTSSTKSSGADSSAVKLRDELQCVTALCDALLAQRPTTIHGHAKDEEYAASFAGIEVSWAIIQYHLNNMHETGFFFAHKSSPRRIQQEARNIKYHLYTIALEATRTGNTLLRALTTQLRNYFDAF